jgi:hypothetical protein
VEEEEEDGKIGIEEASDDNTSSNLMFFHHHHHRHISLQRVRVRESSAALPTESTIPRHMHAAYL